MNTPQNVAAGASPLPLAASPSVVPARRLFYWSVRRELWEFRSIYIAPLAAAAIALFGFLLSTVHLAGKVRAASLDPLRQHELLVQPYHFAALLIMGSTFIVSIFYCLDALHGERRDRSILFWKSLPVSDLVTVLSKTSIPLVVLPLLTFAVTVVTQFIIFVLSAFLLLACGLPFSTLSGNISLLPMWVMVFFHLFAIHSLWYAPMFGWLLLVSVWARRTPFLWATLPLLAIGLVEKIAFNTLYFGDMLKYRILGGSEDIPFPEAMGTAMSPYAHFAPGKFLVSPGLWIGLAVAAIFLAVAVRLRRDREPI